jgi:AcrR family transcriptional regulator
LKSQRFRRSLEEARSEILRAAEAVLAEKDFGALTVDLVMQRTGMTRSSFYHYFNGLDDLAVDLLRQFEDDIRASVDPWLRGEYSGDPRTATVSHLSAMFEVMHEHRASARAVAQAAGGYPQVYREWQSGVVDYFIAQTAAFLRQEVKAGRSRADDPERLARALILMNNGVANDGILRDAIDDHAAMARVLADIWNAAIYGADG